VSASSARNERPHRDGIRRWLGLGVLGAVTLIAMEFLVLPRGLAWSERLEIARNLFVQWSACAVAIAALASYAERRWRPGMMALLFVGFALGATLALHALRYGADLLGIPIGGSVYTGQSTPLASSFSYNLWVLLFFGGLFMTACVLGLRAERVRDARAATKIARNRSEALLADARLQALQAHVDPAFLLRVMTEVEQRYIARAQDADRLLQRLVAFLRLAMPGVRGRHVTLADELELVAAHGALWADLDPARAAIAIRCDGAPAKVPFPPLWLLPVLDRWAEAAPVGSRATLRIACSTDGVALALEGVATPTGDWMPQPLAYRLRVALQQLFDDRWQLVIRSTTAPGAPALSLTFVPHVPPATPRVPPMHVADEPSPPGALPLPAGR
jgi:hypothetical protein